MKRLFSICMDKNSEDTAPEEEFLIKNYEDDKLFEELESITKMHVDSVTKSRFKSMSHILAISIISMSVTLISMLLINRYAGESNAYTVLLLIPMIFSVIGIVAIAKYKRGTAEYAASEEVLQLNADRDSAIRALYETVGVPKDAVAVDIIEYSYKLDKNGEEKTDGFNTLFRTWVYFRDEDKLYFSDEYSVYAFPIEAFKEIRYTERSISVLETDWSKPEPPTSDKYSSRSITVSKGLITFSEYLSVILEYNGETYEFRAAPYEALTLSRITGLYPKR